MQNYLIQAADASLGWSFYWPLLGMVVMIILGVRIWAVVGLGSPAADTFGRSTV